MRRRVLVLFAVIAGMSIAASPVLAADVSHRSLSGTGMTAIYDNTEYDTDGGYLPGGPYTTVQVDGSIDTYTGYAVWPDDPWVDATARVWLQSFMVDENGVAYDVLAGSNGGPYEALTLSPKLAGSHLVANYEVWLCRYVDGVCVGNELVTVDVDLTLTGVGKTSRYGDGSSGGTPGEYRTAWHGTGWQRDAGVAGTLTVNGAPLPSDGTWRGVLNEYGQGVVEVTVR
jgi:hypothetical protein